MGARNGGEPKTTEQGGQIARIESADFFDREHRGQSRGAFGADGIEHWQRLLEHSVEEQDRAQGLILSAGSDVLFHSQVGEASFDFRRAHGFRVAFAVEEDELSDPAEVRFLGPFRVVKQPAFITDAVEESRLSGGGRLRQMTVERGHRAPLARDQPPAIVSRHLYLAEPVRLTLAIPAIFGFECAVLIVAASRAVLLAVWRRRGRSSHPPELPVTVV